MKKYLFAVLLGVLSFAAAGCSNIENGSKNSNTNQNSNQTAATDNETSETNVNTSEGATTEKTEKPEPRVLGTDTYVNEKFGYSVKLPADWMISEKYTETDEGRQDATITVATTDFAMAYNDGFPEGTASGAEFVVMITKPSTFKTFDELTRIFEDGQDFHYEKSEDIATLADEQAVHHILDYYEDYHLLHGDEQYDIIFRHAEEGGAEFEKIWDDALASFKFLD
ncbi:MAG: hypothetical protein A3F54_03955 [Candidatus Kerfeldbacteria bacterium RIFCSPHIGHO2_12_FULL_48_17]|uniref:PsbP C-terminal domain-containing protein n=1 Tax=Candidatus Kerfeldbacteria bacterium RIFCSPHIGHO2_12_FULL_48_17 TaxID=1798542 RepID=A0A1G2B5Q6_9BACT|nr:MAG: hypothetical protein A3F54_03955 [Candidatus Kerfeldbacteria bacterium RIFCSPHIGHO2_12_FULL_48_17]